MPVGAKERLANSTGHRQAGNGDHLAYEKLPTVLDLEGSKRQSGSTRRNQGGPGSDSQNEPREQGEALEDQREPAAMLLERSSTISEMRAPKIPSRNRRDFNYYDTHDSAIVWRQKSSFTNLPDVVDDDAKIFRFLARGAV
jgi:hypothetical protein